VKLLDRDVEAVGAHPGEALTQSGGVSDRLRSMPLQPRHREVGLDRGIRQMGQQHLADRRRVRRQTHADANRIGKRSAILDARDVDDIDAVEHADTAGLARALDDIAHDRIGNFRKRCGGEVAGAEFEDARGQAPHAVVRAGIPQVLVRQKDTPHHGAGQSHTRDDLARAEGGIVTAEGTEHLDAALDALDAIARPVFRHCHATIPGCPCVCA